MTEAKDSRRANRQALFRGTLVGTATGGFAQLLTENTTVSVIATVGGIIVGMSTVPEYRETFREMAGDFRIVAGREQWVDYGGEDNLHLLRNKQLLH